MESVKSLFILSSNEPIHLFCFVPIDMLNMNAMIYQTV